MIEVIYENSEGINIENGKVVVRLASIHETRAPVRNFELLLDTGAIITLLNKERADGYGYKIVKEKGCELSGFSEKGLLCDFRVIPTIVFCGFKIKDVHVATPHFNGVQVTEVLGMNLLENFDFGVSLTKEELFLNARRGFESQKPRYKCGEVSLIRDEINA